MVYIQVQLEEDGGGSTKHTWMETMEETRRRPKSSQMSYLQCARL